MCTILNTHCIETGVHNSCLFSSTCTHTHAHTHAHTHTHTRTHAHTHTHTHTVYDSGAVFDPSVLDISEDDLLKKFMEVRISQFAHGNVAYQTHLSCTLPLSVFQQIFVYYCILLSIFVILQGIANVAAVSLQIGYPTVASVPHSIVNGFKVKAYSYPLIVFSPS